MNIKKSLLLMLTVVLVFSCKQEELLERNADTANLTSDLNKHDNSNLGIYKGVFTTLDASDRGTVEVNILDNVASRATLTLRSGATYVFQSTSVVRSGQDTVLRFVSVAESKDSVTFDFSVNSDGSNVEITNTTLGSKASHILAVKETSRGVALGVPGTYACVQCGTHPSLGLGAQTFNAVFVSDPLGEGSSTMTTQFTLNGVVFTSPATDNSQDGGSCVMNGNFTTCDISGSTTIGANAMTWTGSHFYNNDTAINCSEMSGTWAHPGYGGISGTFVSDTRCGPAAIGDLREGGVVFWVDPLDNTKGLVCAFSDSGPLAWGCNATDLPNVPNVNFSLSGPGAEIGWGMSNTNNILIDCTASSAALAARSLGPEWFLPSINELEEMFVNKSTLEAVAGFSAFSPWYWSSSEDDDQYAWEQNFSFNFQFSSNKSTPLYVRAVRAF